MNPTLTVDRYIELVNSDMGLLLVTVNGLSFEERIKLRTELERRNFPYYLRQLYFDFIENKHF